MMLLNYTSDEDELLQAASVVVFSSNRSLTDPSIDTEFLYNYYAYQHDRMAMKYL